MMDLMAAGKLPFRAEITSKDGSSSSMEVSNVTVIRDGVATTLVDERLVLSTNSIEGDKTGHAAATISVPVDGRSPGTITTIGNASVTNDGTPPRISIEGGKKKLRATCPGGLFAVARIATQRDTGSGYFDFLFGRSGDAETTDEAGRKNRSHVAIHPDGNGKFIRLSGHACDLQGDSEYDATARTVRPRVIRIRSTDLGAIVEAVFSSATPGECVLMHLRSAN